MKTADVTDFFQMLLTGEADGVQSLFAGAAVIDDPRPGRVSGEREIAEFAAAYPEWVGSDDIEAVAVTETDARVVAEFVIGFVREDRRIPLPVALAADREEDGALTAIRIYYSMWPLLGHHIIRAPLLPEEISIELPDVVDRYHEALTCGYLDEIVDSFEDDGYAREPSGGPWIYAGRQRLHDFYNLLFSNEGGIVLEHCRYTDDGTRGALEYNAIRWGQTPLTPQAGIAVYERGPSGLLAAARIYDDVEPPV